MVNTARGLATEYYCMYYIEILFVLRFNKDVYMHNFFHNKLRSASHTHFVFDKNQYYVFLKILSQLYKCVYVCHILYCPIMCDF